MTFHLLAYSSSIVTGTAYGNVDAAADTFLSKNDHFVYGDEVMIVAACALSSNLERARIVAPSLVTPPQIRPIIRATTAPTDPNLCTLLECPLRIRPTEEIGVEAQHADVGSETVRALLWVTKGLVPKPNGSVFAIRGTSSGSSEADVWARTSVNWDEELPRGRYAVVGSELYASTSLAYRWGFDDTSFYPGALSLGAVGDRGHSYFYGGTLGVWGYFNAPVMPRLWVFDADNTDQHVVFLHVVRIE